MSEDLSAIVRLHAASEKMSSMLREIARLRRLPDDRVDEARRIKAYNGESSGYGNRYGASKPAWERYQIAYAAFLEGEHAVAARERDELIASLARQAEALRAALPQMAAQAAIELGVLARQWREESKS